VFHGVVGAIVDTDPKPSVGVPQACRSGANPVIGRKVTR
jgi:hypothetical protein